MLSSCVKLHKFRRNAKNILYYNAECTLDSDRNVFAIPVYAGEYVGNTNTLPRTCINFC